MKKYFLASCIILITLACNAQLILFLDKGDIFKSPEVDMVVMDKYSFAKYHFISEKYDTLKMAVLHYDSLLEQRDSTEKQIRLDYERILKNKDSQIEAITDGYQSMKSNLQESIDRQNKLQVDYLKLERKNRRAKRWRNFFMGTTAVLGAVIYILVR